MIVANSVWKGAYNEVIIWRWGDGTVGLNESATAARGERGQHRSAFM